MSRLICLISGAKVTLITIIAFSALALSIAFMVGLIYTAWQGVKSGDMVGMIFALLVCVGLLVALGTVLA